MPPDALARAGRFALVLVLTVLLAVWGAFFVPLRLNGVPVPVGLVLALATVPLGLAGGRALGSRLGVVLPGALWLLVGIALGSRRAEGDLVITGGGLGVLFLLVGTLGAAVTAGLWRPPRPTAPPPPPA